MLSVAQLPTEESQPEPKKASAAEVMYPGLYKGLNLKPEDLVPYSSPLISFDRKLVIPKGMIRLSIQTGPEIVEVNFIVMDSYS